MKTIQEAHDEGQAAFRQELSSDANPYGEKDQRHYAWLDGYHDKEKENVRTHKTDPHR